MKGSLCKEERFDETFNKFKEKAYQLYDNQYEYEGFVSYDKPVTVINRDTGIKYKQRIQHILKGSRPSDEVKRIYTKENCQSFSDLVHNKRFIVDVNTFENINSIVTLTDTTTNLKYLQSYRHHIDGSLPKEISYSNISKMEKRIIEDIKSIYPNIEIISGYRPKWLKGKEIDIYLPIFKIGIEYNRYYLSSF